MATEVLLLENNASYLTQRTRINGTFTNIKSTLDTLEQAMSGGVGSFDAEAKELGNVSLSGVTEVGRYYPQSLTYVTISNDWPFDGRPAILFVDKYENEIDPQRNLLIHRIYGIDEATGKVHRYTRVKRGENPFTIWVLDLDTQDIKAEIRGIETANNTTIVGEKVIREALDVLASDIEGNGSLITQTNEALSQAITNFEDQISGEETARANGDATLQQNIDALNSSAQTRFTELDQTDANLQSTIDTEIATRSTEVATLQNSISALSDQLSQLTTNINDQITALNNKIDNEKSERVTADNNLNSSVSNLSQSTDTRFNNVDSKFDLVDDGLVSLNNLIVSVQANLTSAIDNEAQRRRDDIAAVEDQLSTEVTNRINALETLKGELEMTLSTAVNTINNTIAALPKIIHGETPPNPDSVPEGSVFVKLKEAGS